jgi:predicted transcriptional regulator
MRVIIGVMPQEKIRERMLAIASGRYKPRRNEPKIWFTSMRSLAEVLSDDNQALLRIIQEKKPATIAELADLTGRRASNLSRTLHTLANYGLVELNQHGRRVEPTVKSTDFQIITTPPPLLEQDQAA